MKTENVLKILSGKRKIYPKDWQEALQRWDNGESVFTIEMGGIGPGYEQCIHITCFELLRVSDKWFGIEDEEQLKDAMNKVINENHICKKLELSGAQAGAAKNLAWHYRKADTWESVLNEIEIGRHIQVSKKFI